MEFRVFSDLHIDRSPLLPITNWVTKEDKHRALIIAGDICSLTKKQLMKDLLLYLSSHFKYLFITLGNHEYAEGDLQKTPLEMKQLLLDLKTNNVFLLQKGLFLKNDLLIIGTTLWSDLSINKKALSDKDDSKHASFFEKNHSHLNRQERYNKMHFQYCEEKKWLFGKIKKYRPLIKKIIVVTHYAPSFKSIHPIFKHDKHQHHYASNLDKDIKAHMPDIWLHGHTHHHCDYYIGKTRILANPFGLPGEETKFNKNCLFSL